MRRAWLEAAALGCLLVACSANPPASAPPAAAVAASAPSAGPKASVTASAAPTPPPVQASLSPPAAVPTAPEEEELVREPRPDDYDGPGAAHRRTPDAVEVEEKHLAEAYRRFETLTRLPDFLSVNAVLALYPDAALREELRDEIHAQFEGRGLAVLFGAWLDEKQDYFALWVTQHLSQALAIYHRGRLTHKKVISRAQEPLLRELLPEAKGARLEIAFEHITNMSACCLPKSFDVYRVSDAGTLVQVLSFPKSHVQVGPGVRWYFLNHFEFSETGVVVTQVVPESGPRYEFLFQKGLNRYVPTAATSKLLRDEQARDRELPGLEY